MKDKKMQKGVLLIIAIVVLLLLMTVVLPPLARPKARASRITSVNRVATISISLPATNALPNPATNK